jgi:hypothetical protein
VNRISKAEECEEVYAQFPRFSSSADPLADVGQSSSLTMDDVCARSLWLAFLVLPCIVLMLGVVFRYDLQIALVNSPFNLSGMAHLVEGRTRDLLSLLLDGINLVAFYFSLLFLIRLTTHPYDAERRQPKRVEVIMYYLLWASFAALWVSRMYRVSYTHYGYLTILWYLIGSWREILSFGVYLLFGLISIAALKRSISARSVTGFVVSFLLLVFSVFILF